MGVCIVTWVQIRGKWGRAIVLGGLGLLTGCGGGGGGSIVGFTISVTVNGLSGSGLVLRVNSVQSLPVSANGVVTFASPLPSGAAYLVTVAATPSAPAQFCSVANGAGTVAAANITNVVVSCQTVIRSAYVVNLGSNSVSQFNVAADGNLSPMTPPTVFTGNSPSSIALDPLGRFAYIAFDGNVAQFAIAAGGQLEPMVPPMVITALTPTNITVNPSGTNAYVTNSNGTVSQFAIGATGALTALAPASVLAGLSPTSIVIHHTGRYAYVANATGNTISQFTLAPDGSLTPMAAPTVLAGTMPDSLAVDTTGQFVHATNVGIGGGTISNFRIGIDGGLVANGAPTNAGLQPRGIAMHPNGRNAYVANAAGNEIMLLEVAANGSLTPAPVPNSTFVPGPRFVVIERTGRFAYATTNNTVRRYAIDPDGRLTAFTEITTGINPIGIALR